MKLSNAAVANRYWQDADLIIGKHIDVLNGIIWGIGYLKNITEKQEQRSESVINFLEAIYETVSDDLKTFTKEDEKEKNKLIHNIYLALNKSSQFIAGQNLMVSAIDKLRQYLSFYNEREVEIKAMQEIKNMLEAFFQGVQVLDRENYKKFKERVNELSEFSRKFFAQYETTDLSEGTRGDIQDAEYTNVQEQCFPK
jgi:negative regulator of replication initiation